MSRTRLPRWLAILLVSLAGLLLEIGYTRVVSYKLWYYYTYLVIGLSLLGIGTGGVLVALSSRLRRASTDRIIAACSLWGALSIAVGYLVIARVPIDTVRIWDYGSTSSFKNLAALALICFVLFATFIALGVIVSVLLGRAGDAVGRLYFADLLGAGIGAMLAIPLIAWLGPPDVILLSAVIFAVVGLVSLLGSRPVIAVGGGVVVLVIGLGAIGSNPLPDVEIEAGKPGGPGASYYDWGPVFRVDVAEYPGVAEEGLVLYHDGTWGSGLHRFDGDLSALTAYESEARAIPFDVLGKPPERELIIGSAGGNEILASLYFGAPDIEAVELNPVTVSLLRDHYADYTGRIAEHPDVDLHQGDGRTYLARTDDTYDLVWYVAPDSYAANNAASAGAFVLSESYLYTSEMIVETLEHLTDDGIMVVQFGELDFERRPLRTSRYVVTARHALEQLGVDRPSQHIAVSAGIQEDGGDLSTIIVKRTPFTIEERAAFAASVAGIPRDVAVYVPGTGPADDLVAQLAGSDADTVDSIVDDYSFAIDPVRDDAPFFWHFSRFPDVLGDILEPIDLEEVDPEQSIGERVLLLLLVFAALYAAVFLLLPFVAVRRKWATLPRKGRSAVYFAALGLGFMMFEITMIQRLVRFLGYPTYSLTVTLASILVFAGLGALLSRRLDRRARVVVPALVGALGVVTLFYQLGLDGLLDSLQGSSLAIRVITALIVLAPLGLALGMFMPFGLAAVARLTPFGEEYVAWSWAVNGFFSVIGSVLTTIMAMTFGFHAVQTLALAIYLVAAVAFTGLQTGAPPTSPAPEDRTAVPAPA